MTESQQCPICTWQPTAQARWKCACGTSWNTFATRGICPTCQTQWADTTCPRCERSSPHEQWYRAPIEEDAEETLELADLQDRKRRLEHRLRALGLAPEGISYLPYLDYTDEVFRSPYDIGCRLLILYAIAYAAHNLDDRPNMIKWLQAEKLWAAVSAEEQAFFTCARPDEETRLELSWRVEGALVLSWALELVNPLPALDQEDTEGAVGAFMAAVPELGGPTQEFLAQLSLRSLDEVYEENLLNELATAYFRDLLFNEEVDATQINRRISFERHRALNWARTFSGIEDWDETDTST